MTCLPRSASSAGVAGLSPHLPRRGSSCASVDLREFYGGLHARIFILAALMESTMRDNVQLRSPHMTAVRLAKKVAAFSKTQISNR
jgi:hypothetical protein